MMGAARRMLLGVLVLAGREGVRSLAGRAALVPRFAAYRSPPPAAHLSRRARMRQRGAESERRKEMQLDPVEGGGSTAGRPLPFRYLCVTDVEATCERVGSYTHEIIELPVVMIDLVELEVVDEYHTYVRPTVNYTLTSFCTELTGITQARQLR